jgi:nucleoside-diphosphate-sugar epimerase
MSKSDPVEGAVRDIRRKTRKQYSAEEKIRIVVSGRRASLPPTETTSKLAMVPADVCDPAQVRALFQRTRPRAVVHNGAEPAFFANTIDTLTFAA